MTNPFRKLYPEQELIVFDGGLDNKFERSLIPENESPDCLNVEFINGSVTTRQGQVKLNTAAAGASPFDGLYTRRSSDGTSETMCAFIGGHMLTLAGTSFATVPSAQSVFTIGFRVGAELAENYLFIGNGGAGPYKWDGNVFTQHGVSAPVATCSVASGTTGSLTTNGAYVYRVTMVNTHLVESDLGPKTSTFSVSSVGLAINVTNIPVATAPSQGINARYLYRTIAGGSSYLRVTKILDNTTTSFTDTVSDAALGSPAPTDNGVPPQYNAIEYLNNTLFVNDVNNPNYVWYSTAGQPFTFPSTNFFKVGDRTGDLVKGFTVYNNSLFIVCELSTWMLYMEDPSNATTWRPIRTNSPYGSASPYCLLPCSVRGQNILFHAAMENRIFVGFAALMGQTIDPAVTFQTVTNAGSNLQSQVIEPDMFLVQTTNPQNISGIVFKSRAFVTLAFGTGATTNNRVYVWDFSASNLKKNQPASWVPWSGPLFNFAQFTIYQGKLYGAASTSTGFVYRIADTGTYNDFAGNAGVYNDDGLAINSYYWTKEFPGYSPDTALTKDFRFINLMYGNAGEYYMNLRYRVDSDNSTGTVQQINLSSGGTVWGSGTDGLTWGVGLWGGGRLQTEGRIFLGSGIRGKRLQFGFDNQNTVNQAFKVYRAQFLYNLRGYR